MKKFFILAFFLPSILSEAQNYQPLNSNSFQLFFQNSSFNISSWSYDGENLWGTRIDSIELNINVDSIFYNYKIVRDTALDNGVDIYNERCVWIYAPNWNGNKTIVTASGNSWFFNEWSDSILLKHTALIDSSWLAYTYEDGSFLKAKVEDVFWTDDIWTQDSVKTISFLHSDSIGNPIVDNINGRTIELYQNHGFRKAFDFVKFPFDTISLFQLDANYINATKMLIDPTYGTFNQTPEVGDILSSSYYCHAIMDQYPSWSGAESKKVLEVIPYPNNDTLRIKYLRNSSTSQTNIENNPFPPHPVTTTNFSTNEYYQTYYVDTNFAFSSIFGDSLMPREHSVGGLFIPTIGNPSCFYPEIKINTCSWPINEFNTILTDSCYLAPIPFKCNQGGTNYYVPYIGITHNTSGSINDGNDHSCSSYSISYIKVGNYECGGYWFVGIEDYEQLLSEINIYPNPASNTITIQSPSNYQFSFVRIVNAVGQEVYQASTPNVQSSITVSSFASGIYFISLSNGEQTITKKFVKE